MELWLDRLHARARAHPALQRLAVVSRILLAVGFIPPALVKIRGQRFMTVVELADPISYFFDALYRTGAYWRFLGWGQLAAGVCLLFPRTATLGAVLFFPIVLNVFAITAALHFPGTVAVTGLMLLAGLYLLCWDYDRLKAVLWPPAGAPREVPPAGAFARWSPLERAGYALGTVAGLGAFLWTRSLVPHPVIVPCLLLGLVAAGMVLAAWARALRHAAPPRRLT